MAKKPAKPVIPMFEVPVIAPGQSIPTRVAIISTIINMVALFATYVGAPLTSENVVVLIGAFNIIAGVVSWVYDRYFSNQVTITSLPPAVRKKLRLE